MICLFIGKFSVILSHHFFHYSAVRKAAPIFVLLIFFMAGCTAVPAPVPTLAATAEVGGLFSGGNAADPTTTPLPPTHTPDWSPTPGPSPTPSHTPTRTPIPTDTPTPTITPTSLPQLNPVPIEIEQPISEGLATPATAIPSPVPTYNAPANTTNVLLLGDDGGANTDTILIVAINRTGPTASILSIPRDLYVYQPGRTMDRINTAYARGSVELLKQTILYNFGIPIHYYARVDFEGFKEIVNIMGGVDVAVSCELEDWRLKSPELDIEVEENWERFTLEQGVHHMDGDLALWYARSRLTTSDFDRGRRQQQLLQAMFTQGVDLGLIKEFPSLWNTYHEYVETDMDVGRILQLATLAPAVRENGVQHLYLAGKTQPWLTPGGAQVQLPVWEGDNMMAETFTRLFLPPALNRASQPPMTVEIINASGNPDMALLAADNLAWHGFVPIIGEAPAETVRETTLHYYKPNFKGSYAWLISWIFNLRHTDTTTDIELVDEPGYAYNYRVVLGTNYDPCRPELRAPQIFLNEN